MIATIDTPGLTMDEATHEYRFGGIVIPSTTQVLDANGFRSDFSKVRPDVLEAARQRGRAVHLATHYHDEGTLKESTLDPVLVPWLDAWKQFLAERRVKIVELETRYAHPRLLFAGTLDRLAIVEDTVRRSRKTVIDIKTGDETGADFQTAAYAELKRAHGGPEFALMDRWSVRLRPGSAVPYVVTPYRDTHDWSTFRAALEVTHAHAARGRSWRDRYAA